MILRARVVLPLSSRPIANGAVVISGNRITAVGTWRELSGASESSVDLGSVILLPGLVNAHCHLDYTHMTGLPAPKQFPEWIKALVALKASWSYTDYAESWLCGAAMLARTGTTTVADIEASPELLPDVWTATPLRVASFLEMTGVKSKRDPGEILDEAAGKIATLKSQRGLAGLSPHALYSTTPALLEKTARLAREKNWRVTMHVAESAEEFEMHVHRRGPLFHWLQSQRDMSDCGTGTPVEQVHRRGLTGKIFLAVHANYLESGDIRILAETGSSVAHCPRSHAYFRHRAFPYGSLAKAGVNICLGTDSLASMTPIRNRPPELNMFAEMKNFSSTEPDVDPAIIVQMATMNGARALGWAGQVGELSPDSLADLIAIPFSGKTADAYAAVVHHAGDVAASMIDGQWVIKPGGQTEY